MKLQVKKIKQDFFKNVAIVSIGNAFFLFSNIVVGFFLPFILGVTGYGYYRIYVLYTSYSGILHLGFVDGILLKFAGKDYEELDKPAFRRYSQTFLILETIISIIIVFCSLVCGKGEYRVLICLVGINVILYNGTLYFQYISQAVSRYKEFSTRKILSAIGTLILIIIFYLGKMKGNIWSNDYRIYIGCTLFVNFILFSWYLYTYKDILYGYKNSLKQEYLNILSLLKMGIVMTIAYETSRLVLVIDQQFVSILFDIDIYSQYSFAYNILSCVTAVITGISTVLLPQMRKKGQKEAIGEFDFMMTTVSAIVCFSLLGYHPIRFIVMTVMPEYIDALVYFKIIFPVLALSSCITIVVFTYYKILNKNIIYLLVCAFSLVISAIFNLFAYMIWKSTVAISMVTVIATVIWYLLSIIYLRKNYQIKWKGNFIYIISLITIFYITVFAIKNIFISMLSYLCAYLVITLYRIRTLKH